MADAINCLALLLQIGYPARAKEAEDLCVGVISQFSSGKTEATHQQTSKYYPSCRVRQGLDQYADSMFAPYPQWIGAFWATVCEV